MKRRNFIKTVATASGIGTAAFTYGRGKTGYDMLEKSEDALVIEWNAHVFSPDLVKYPFHPQATYHPDVSLQAKDPLAAYLSTLDERGIDKAVIVHPEPYGDDHTLILDCLNREPDRLRGTSLFYPKDDKSPMKLAALVRREPRIVATRFHAHRGKESYLDSFADAGVRALWKQAVDLDIIIELHIGPNYARQAGEAIRAFPGSKVLIDHLAEPHMGNAVEYAEVLALADIPEVYMKLSGINHFAEDAPLYRTSLNFTRMVIDAFGPERIVWGSGSPQIVDEHMEAYSRSAINKVKGTNLRRWLKWS